jgi:DNA repair ATPase RecN
MEDEMVGDLSRSLIPIRQTLENTLLSIGKLAEEMETEKVKVEDEKFKPSVESSRKILVSSLKKEDLSDFPVPTSITDARKFQERLQSLMERFGDVSGSHSKLLTTFMKKHTGKIKGEFDTISSLEKRTGKIMEAFEEDRRPVTNCITILSKTSQLVDSIKQQEIDLQKLRAEISRLEAEYQELANSLSGLERSSDFETTAKTMEAIKLAQEEEKEFHKYLSDHFSHVSRALTKYSYGMSKATSSKLQILMTTPWKIFTGANQQKEGLDYQQQSSHNDELESYKSLLIEVQKAVSSGKITLKDSDKTLKYFEMIIESLPGFQKKSEMIAVKLHSLEQKKDHSIIASSEDMKKKLGDNRNALDNRQLYLEKLENEIKEKKTSLKGMLEDSEKCIYSSTGKNYSLKIPAE